MLPNCCLPSELRKTTTDQFIFQLMQESAYFQGIAKKIREIILQITNGKRYLVEAKILLAQITKEVCCYTLIKKNPNTPKTISTLIGALRLQKNDTTVSNGFWKKLQRSGVMKLRQLSCGTIPNERLSKNGPHWNRSFQSAIWSNKIFTSISCTQLNLPITFKELWHI